MSFLKQILVKVGDRKAEKRKSLDFEKDEPPSSPIEKLKKKSFHFETLKRQTSFSLTDFNLGKIIGVGQFGKVKLAYHKPTDTSYAIKILKKKEVFLIVSKVREEINALKEIKSQFVVTCYSVLEDKNKIYIIQEYMNGGNLAQFLKKEKLNEKVI